MGWEVGWVMGWRTGWVMCEGMVKEKDCREMPARITDQENQPSVQGHSGGAPQGFIEGLPQALRTRCPKFKHTVGWGRGLERASSRAAGSQANW